MIGIISPVTEIAIQLPDELKTYLHREAQRRGYKDVSQYVQKLIEADQGSHERGGT
jgi:hypothetical protein